jgi:uncharacterized LabA/DUF88 family protein
MKKTAIMIDGGFVNKKLTRGSDPIKQAIRVLKVAQASLVADEDLFRIFYYDCAPFGGKKTDPFGTKHNFAATPQFSYQTRMLAYLRNQSYVAVRLGELSCGGWKLFPHVYRNIAKKKGAYNFSAADFLPDFSQKGVDMRIGLDVATLAIDRLVDRIIMLTADSDFIPAMKLARREGVQVVLCMLGNAAKPHFAGHADLYRNPSLSNI